VGTLRRAITVAVMINFVISLGGLSLKILVLLISSIIISLNKLQGKFRCIKIFEYILQAIIVVYDHLLFC
jgi:hypothetical protein